MQHSNTEELRRPDLTALTRPATRHPKLEAAAAAVAARRTHPMQRMTWSQCCAAAFEVDGLIGRRVLAL